MIMSNKDISQIESTYFDYNKLSKSAESIGSEYKGWKVPEVLLSGNEKLILNWREEESIKRTKHRRPDLLE